MSSTIGVGVGVLILSPDNKILVGKRKNAYGAGTFALPGGNLEFLESWEECAIRETKEECNIELKRVEYMCTLNMIDEKAHKHYVTIIMKTRTDQQPENKELHKCEGWQWMTGDELESCSPKFKSLELLLSMKKTENLSFI